MESVTLSSSFWNKNVNPCWGITSNLNLVIRRLEIAQTDLLPNLSSSPTLILTSDYGGQHKQATHEAFSFLLADLARCGLWNKNRLGVRNRFLPDNRRIMCLPEP